MRALPACDDLPRERWSPNKQNALLGDSEQPYPLGGIAEPFGKQAFHRLF
jgi:hypothetical protein